jgi:hypothetical protein
VEIDLARPRPANSEKPRVRPIGSLVNQLMSRRGYAQAAANDELRQLIAAVIGGPLESAFQVGNLRQGVLQVYAADSVTLQELNFHKRAILKHLEQQLPSNKVIDLRFRIQS